MARMPGPHRPVDTPHGRSASLASGPSSRPTQATGSWRPVVVGRGRSTQREASFGGLGDPMHGYPIQTAKIQPPPLRDETLARGRLLDWLAAKVNQRVVLV